MAGTTAQAAETDVITVLAAGSLRAALLEAGRADLFITYCTNARVAQREVPALRRIELPEGVDVAARHGVTLLQGAPAAARDFVQFLPGPPGQAVLARHGLAPP